MEQEVSMSSLSNRGTLRDLLFLAAVGTGHLMLRELSRGRPFWSIQPQALIWMRMVTLTWCCRDRLGMERGKSLSTSTAAAVFWRRMWIILRALIPRELRSAI